LSVRLFQLSQPSYLGRGKSKRIKRRLTGARYAQFIGTELPDLLEIVPLAYRINDWFQHDGAPPHFRRNVQEILDNQYPQRWIGRGGPPARSPDLNLNNLKSIIYRRPINSEADLRVRIQVVFVSVTEEMITNATTRSLLRLAFT
jgi:hypothetical protein